MSGNRSIRIEKKNLRMIGAAILFIAALFFVLKIMVYFEEKNSIIDVDPDQENYDQTDEDLEREDRDMIYYNGSWYVRRNDVDTVLLVGIDKDEDFVLEEYSYRNNQQADFLFLLVFDNRYQTLNAIHLNRDTMTEMDTFNDIGQQLSPVIAQLALSHTYGIDRKESARNTVRAVQNMLYDTPVDHYITFTMDTVPAVNDYYGGVTVHLDEDYTWISPDMTQGSAHTLTGDESIRYLRARINVSDGTNLSRMKRHREYIQALLDRTKAEENKDKDVLELFSKLTDKIDSDCTINQLSDYKKKYDEYTLGDIIVIDGETEQGPQFIEFYPDEEKLQDLIIDTFYERYQN